VPVLQKIRLRVLAIVAAGVLGVVGVLSFAAWPVLPVVGVAIITVAAAVNTATARLSDTACMSCGKSVGNAEAGPYGVICPSCGAVTRTLVNDTRRA
jgi:predicted RNA-binding Zn-ribbon protein involved in translation (DUF1610 family)